MAIINLYISL